MALHFNHSRVADPSVLMDKNGEYNYFCQQVCFRLMSVGIKEVTVDNISEIIARTKLLNVALPYGVTLVAREDWERVVGLSTNVTPESWSRWTSKVAKDAGISVAALMTKALAS